jgi:hypothetical protein
LAEILGGRKFRARREEVFREVGVVIEQRSERKTGRNLAMIVAKTKARLGRETGKGTAAAIGITIVAARRVGERIGGARLLGDRGRWAGLSNSGSNGSCRCVWVESAVGHSFCTLVSVLSESGLE